MKIHIALLASVAAVLLACNDVARAQNMKLDAPASPPVPRPAPPVTEAYVDAGDPPLTLKFSVVDTTYAAEVPAAAGGASTWVTGFLKNGVMDATVTGPDGQGKSLNLRWDGRTIDLPLLGKDRHFTRVDTSLVRIALQPGGPPQPVREVDGGGWHYPLPEGWVAKLQPGGVSVGSPDHNRGFGFFCLTGLDTSDPGQLVRRVVEQNGATSAKVIAKSFSPQKDPTEATFDIAFAGPDHVARHLFVDAVIDPHVAPRTGWVTVVVALPDDWKVGGDALHDMTDRVRPTSALNGGDRFAGVYTDGRMTVTVRRDDGRPGDAYTGSIVQGGRKFPLAVAAQGDTLTGTFADETAGHAFPITATVTAGTMTLRTGGSTYTLRTRTPAATAPAD